MVGGTTPSTWNFGSTGPCCSEIADFEPIFACSASAVTPSEKFSITLIESFSNESKGYSSKPPMGGSEKQCPKFKQQSAITSKRYEIGCQLGPTINH